MSEAPKQFVGPDTPEGQPFRQPSPAYLPPVPNLHDMSAAELDDLTVSMFADGVQFDNPLSDSRLQLADTLAALFGFRSHADGARSPLEAGQLNELVNAIGFLAAHQRGEEIGDGTLTMSRLIGHSAVRLSIEGSVHDNLDWHRQTVDELTGIALSRFGLDRVLASNFGMGGQSTERRRRDDRRPYMLGGDLCNFKRINDVLGHGVGDEAIRQAFEELRGHIRAADFLGRPHRKGDEVQVLFFGDNDGDAMALHARINSAQLEKAQPGRGFHKSRYELAWEAIMARPSRPDDWTVSLLGSDQGEVRWLCDRGEPVVPLSDILVLSFGMVPFEYGNRESYEAAQQAVDRVVQEHKNDLRQLIGRYDRPED